MADKIHISIPLLGDVIDDDEKYFDTVFLLTAMPIDLMVFLDDIGIDFEEISDYDLFLFLFKTITSENAKLVFDDIEPEKFKLAINEQNGMRVLVNEDDDIVIDRGIQLKIADTLRRINGMEKDIRHVPDKDTRKYLIDRARKKMRRKKKDDNSVLEEMIVALVNTEQFHYNYDSIRDLTVYQFNRSFRQINHKIDFDNRMHGIYAGTINPKDINPADLSWIKQK